MIDRGETEQVGKIDLDDHPITVWLRRDPDGSYVVDIDTGDDDADVAPEQVSVEVCLNDGLLHRRTPPPAGTCTHCSRTIHEVDGRWVDLQATGDDSLWRETCDAHDTFTAEHERS